MVACPVLRRRREDQWVVPGAGALLLMIGTTTGQEEGGDVAVEGEGGGESTQNSSLAKEVEKWLPLFLGLLLGSAVVGWCALNVYRASKAQKAKDAAAAADVKAYSSNGTGRHASNRLKSFHGMGDIEAGGSMPGTGDVSPETYSYESNMHPKGSLRSTSMRSSSLRGSAAVSGNHGVLHGAGAGSLMPQMIFKGDELQGKKAPGEDGNVYRNPMQRARQVSTPDTGEATDTTTHSSGSLSVSSRWSSAKAPRSSSRQPAARANGDEGDAGATGGGEARRGGDGGGGHRRKTAASATARGKQQAERRQQQQQHLAGRGGGRNKSRNGSSGSSGGERRNSDSSSGSGGGGGGRRGSGTITDESSHYSTAEDEEGDAQGSNLSRALRPAVLRAARPIPRNPSSSAVERASDRYEHAAAATGRGTSRGERRGDQGGRDRSSSRRPEGAGIEAAGGGSGRSSSRGGGRRT